MWRGCLQCSVCSSCRRRCCEAHSQSQLAAEVVEINKVARKPSIGSSVYSDPSIPVCAISVIWLFVMATLLCDDSLYVCVCVCVCV